MYTYATLLVGIFLACSSLSVFSQCMQADFHGKLPINQPDSLHSFSLNMAKIELAPRSASDNTHLHIFSPRAARGILQILGLGDEVLETKAISVRPGFQTIPISLYQIPSGWYWVKIKSLRSREEVPLYFPLLIER